MNKTNQNILQFLDYYCRHKTSLQYTVMVNGKWGSGKTHLVRRFLEEQQDIKTLYVSLYGLKEISDIEDAFFAKLHPKLASKGMKIAATVLKGMLKSKLAIDLEKIGHVNASMDAAIPELSIPSFLKDAGERVLIFDDVERAEIPIKKLMGYINAFVEHDDSKVILIANEDEICSEPGKEAERKAYFDTKEKLVGKTFDIEVDFSAAADAFTGAIEDPVVREFFELKRTKVATIFRQSETDNLRILQQAMWDFERLLLALEPGQRKKVEALDAIFGPFFALYFEARANRLKPEDMNGLDSVDWSRVLDKKKAEKSRRQILEERYPEITFEESIVGAEALGAAIFRSSIDAEAIKKRVEASPYFAKPGDVPSWRRFWYHSSVPDAEAQIAFEDVEKKFQGREYTEAGVLLHVFGLRLWSSGIGLISLSKSEVLKQCKTYVDDLYIAKRLPAIDTETERYDRSSQSYDGLGYYDYESKEFQEALTYLIDARRKTLSDTYPEMALRLFDEMAESPDHFFRQLNVTQHMRSDYAGIPILSYSAPAEFVGRALALPKDSLRTVLMSFKERYNYLNSFPDLAAELPWLKKVEKLFLAEAQKRNAIGKHDLTSVVECYLSAPLKEAEAFVEERKGGRK